MSKDETANFFIDIFEQELEMALIKSFIFGAFIILTLTFSALAQTTGGLRGQVVDELGQVVVGATVIAVDSAGKEKKRNFKQ